MPSKGDLAIQLPTNFPPTPLPYSCKMLHWMDGWMDGPLRMPRRCTTGPPSPAGSASRQRRTHFGERDTPVTKRDEKIRRGKPIGNINIAQSHRKAEQRYSCRHPLACQPTQNTKPGRKLSCWLASNDWCLKTSTYRTPTTIHTHEYCAIPRPATACCLPYLRQHSNGASQR